MTMALTPSGMVKEPSKSPSPSIFASHCNIPSPMPMSIAPNCPLTIPVGVPVMGFIDGVWGLPTDIDSMLDVSLVAPKELLGLLRNLLASTGQRMTRAS